MGSIFNLKDQTRPHPSMVHLCNGWLRKIWNYVF